MSDQDTDRFTKELDEVKSLSVDEARRRADEAIQSGRLIRSEPSSAGWKNLLRDAEDVELFERIGSIMSPGGEGYVGADYISRWKGLSTRLLIGGEPETFIFTYDTAKKVFGVAEVGFETVYTFLMTVWSKLTGRVDWLERRLDRMTTARYVSIYHVIVELDIVCRVED
jgi:hypothetical protein